MPSVPFLVNETLTEVVHISVENSFFCIELSFDVSRVEELPMYYIEEPEFRFSIQCTRIISPCSSESTMTLFPFHFSKNLEITINSEQNGITYLQKFALSVLDIKFNFDVLDVVTQMPETQVQFSLNTLPRERTMPHEIRPTFYCNYCSVHHPNNWNSDEHIIPEALKNRNYVLKNTCKRLNHYMSFLYETKAFSLDIVKEVLLIAEPPQKPVYRGKVENSLGKNIFPYIQPSGKMTIVEHPTFTITNSIELNVKGADGENYKYDLVLPFSFKNSISGPREMLDPNKTSQAELAKVSEYLRTLSKDVSINPGFETFLERIGATFNYGDCRVEIAEVAPSEEILFLKIKQYFNSDNEVLFRLFLKIAWTYAVKAIGLENLQNPIANSIIYYLKSGHFLDFDLVQKAPDFFKKAKIVGKEYIFWKHGLDDTLLKIQDVEDKQLSSDLFEAYYHRRMQFDFARACLIGFSVTEELDDDFRENNSNLKTHSLELKNLISNDTAITVCHIKLFGGFFDATVQISGGAIMAQYPDIRIIEF